MTYRIELISKLLLFPLIAIDLVLRAGGFVYVLEYQAPQGKVKQEIRQEYLNVKFDSFYNQETYDPLSNTVHLTPGRFI
jgi:phage pi2 protein 07